jgi:pyruvate/2-oxoglutarate dehydrogenase complex dihydrolipoamide acyltransferase (E2) component
MVMIPIGMAGVIKEFKVQEGKDVKMGQAIAVAN